MAHDILIVDDEADIRMLIGGILEDDGHQTRAAADSTAAIEAIHTRRPSLVVLDIWLQGSPMDGLEVLDIIKRDHPDVPVVVISGHGNIETAVASIKRGAYEYIEKPFKADRLLLVVERATVKLSGQTGVEMEALTAVSVACLTIYDMVKAADRGMKIEAIRLVEKSGGKSGTYRAE